MAVTASTVPTLLDITQSLDPQGKPAMIAEVLNKTMPILDDIAWKEGNLSTGERTNVRTSLPSVYFRALNEGVPRSKSTAAVVDEGAAMLEAYSEVDRKLAMLAGNIAAYRMGEAKPFMEAMGQRMAQTMFYGNAGASPKEFTGLAPRFNSKSGPTASQIIDAGGTGTDNRSIWLVAWGVNTVTGIYPKGTPAGLFHEDVTSNIRAGEGGAPIGDTLYDANGNAYMGYKDHYEWNCGLSVKDPRYVVRIANIDKSDLTYDGATGAKLISLMIQAIEAIQSTDDTGTNVRFYAPRVITSFLRQQITNKGNVWLSPEQVAGRRVTAFDGIPVRRTDALEVDEARVV